MSSRYPRKTGLIWRKVISIKAKDVQITISFDILAHKKKTFDCLLKYLEYTQRNESIRKYAFKIWVSVSFSIYCHWCIEYLVQSSKLKCSKLESEKLEGANLESSNYLYNRM